MDIRTALVQSGAFKVKNRTVPNDTFFLGGGLNVMEPPLAMQPGYVIGCNNFEPALEGGYRRVDGYERFSGQASPSLTAFISIPYASAGGFTPSPGATVTESGSGATGTVTYLDSVNNAVVIVPSSGTFVGAGSTLTSGSQTATTTGTPILNGGATTALSNQYFYENFLYLQSLIGPVGGSSCSGPVYGVVPYGSTVYAFRNNAAGTAGTMWKATSSGWQQVALGTKVRYSNGVYASSMLPIPEGTVLTGQTSGATFTVRRVATLTGTWGTDAEGYIITDAITGTPTANENLLMAGTVVATYLSNAAQVLPVGGTYRFRTHNFLYAQDPSTGFRLYGVNGVGNGFEYDGTTFTLIETGMTTDTPQFLEVHADYLFYGFPDGSLQNSGFQLPLNWNPVYGADARSVGATITFMREDVSNTLIIGTRQNIWYLTGLQVEQFQIFQYATTTGAIENTDQSLGAMIIGEDRGFTSLQASAQYGNFDATSLSAMITDLIVAQFAKDTPIGAIVTRKKNLYRLVFASGAVYSLGINAGGKYTGWLKASWAHPPQCVVSGFTQQTGQPEVERAFFGSTNGYVYEIDAGRSFDGQAVDFFLKTAYWHSKKPSINKRYRRVFCSVRPEGQASVSAGVDLDYSGGVNQINSDNTLESGGTLWDVGTWDAFTWDAPTYTQMSFALEVEGYNISLSLSGSAQNDSPFTVSDVTYQYDARFINRTTMA